MNGISSVPSIPLCKNCCSGRLQISLLSARIRHCNVSSSPSNVRSNECNQSAVLSFRSVKTLCVRTISVSCKFEREEQSLITTYQEVKISEDRKTCCDDETVRIVEKSMVCQSNILFHNKCELLFLQKRSFIFVFGQWGQNRKAHFTSP